MEGDFGVTFLVLVNCYSISARSEDVAGEFLIVETIPSVGSLICVVPLPQDFFLLEKEKG